MGGERKKVVIKPPSSVWDTVNLREVAERLDLLLAFFIRDLKVRYRRTVLGIGWAVLQPFFQMVIFSVIFGKFARIPSGEIPYPLFVYSALVPWQFFSRSLTEASMSVVANSHIIQKIYFPRIILPLASLISGLVDFFFAFLMIFVLMLIFGFTPSPNAFLSPFFLFVQMLCALGVALWLSALNVKFRDIKYTLNFINQIWLFSTPVIYPLSIIPEKWHFIFAFNPMTFVVEGWRWCLLGQPLPPIHTFFISLAVILIILFSGFLYFHKVEREFSDII